MPLIESECQVGKLEMWSFPTPWQFRLVNGQLRSYGPGRDSRRPGLEVGFDEISQKPVSGLPTIHALGFNSSPKTRDR